MDKYNLSDIFSDLNSESSVIMPKSIKIKNIKDLDTISNNTSSFMPQKGAYTDATSSFMPQKGGYSNNTSSFMPQKGGYLNGTKNKDINQLISMLSDTSYDNYTTNSTDTEQLKKKLLNIVQDGGLEKQQIQSHALAQLQERTPAQERALAQLLEPVQAQELALAQLSQELQTRLESELLQYSVEEEGNNFIKDITNYIKDIPNFIMGVPIKVILTREETKKYNKLITDLYIKYSELNNKLSNNELSNNELSNNELKKIKEEIISTEELIYASPQKKSDIYEQQMYAYEKKQDDELRELRRQTRELRRQTHNKYYDIYNDELRELRRQTHNKYYDIYNDLLEAMALCAKVANHLKYKEYITQTIKK